MISSPVIRVRLEHGHEHRDRGLHGVGIVPQNESAPRSHQPADCSARDLRPACLLRLRRMPWHRLRGAAS